MSDSEGCDINCTCVRCKGKKRVTRIEETSCSDSDSPVAKSTKRKKAPRVLSDGQGSSSETDSFVLVKRKKRKHAPRVMSDDEASSGSGPRPIRRKQSVRVVSESEEGSSSDEYGSSVIDDNADEEVHEEDRGGEARESSSDSWEEGEESGSVSSGWESDWTSMDEEFDEDMNEDDRTVSTKLPGAASSALVNASCDSDSSDGQSEKCPICLRNFTTQEVGTPESCDHSFCAVCLQEWAKNMNTCPVDRQAFTLILVRSCLEGKIVRRIPVESREQRDDDEEIQEDPTPCEICGRCDREDRLLLCDECDSGYHLDCLDPPLETVPVEEWFCPECVIANSTQIADEAPIGDGELFDLIDDAHATIGTSPLRRRVNRLLPRTRQSERVRTTIIRQEIERQVAAGGTQPSTSSGVDSLDSASRLSLFFGSRRPTTGVKKKVVRRKRKYRRKVRRRTKTSTKTSTKSKTTTKSKVSVTKKSGITKRKVKKKTTKKTKRQTKRKTVRRRKLKRCRVARSTIPHSVKGRLAEQLGMRAPKIPGQMLPDVRARNTPSNINFQRSLAGIPTLHIFGQPDQIDYFSSGSDLEDGVSGGTGVSAIAPRHRTSAARSARNLVKRKLLSPSAVRSHSVIGQQQASAGPCDLISSILDSQAVWHSKKAVVSINRDRSFTVKGDIQKKKSVTPSSPSSPPIQPVLNTDDRVSSILNETPVNVNDTSATGTQAPMYPGRDGSGGSRPPSSGYQNFGNPRYNSSSSGSYGSYQGARTFVPFGNPSGFDNRDSRAGYSDFLHGGPPIPFQGGSPVRFRMPTRFPQRRPPFHQRGANNSQQAFNRSEETKRDESDWKSNDENSNEEDEVDIYSDIEVAGAGGDATEDVEPRHQMFDSLPPPPLPPAMLIGLGEQDSDDDSDEDLVIDDKTPQASSPQNMDRVQDSEKYDPAEPSYDSDNESQHPEQIPLPSSAPVNPAYSTSLFMTNSSNSNNSYLHSPVYDDSNSHPDTVVSQVVKEVLKVHLEASSSANEERCTSSLDGDDEENEECPNFSIYSAASMDIARNTDTEAIIDPLPVTKDSTSEKEFGNMSLEREDEKEFQTDSGTCTPDKEETREHDCATPDLKDENSNASEVENSSNQTVEKPKFDKEVKNTEQKNEEEMLEGQLDEKVDDPLLEIEGPEDEKDEHDDKVTKDDKEIDDDDDNVVKGNNEMSDEKEVEDDKEVDDDKEMEDEKEVEDYKEVKGDKEIDDGTEVKGDTQDSVLKVDKKKDDDESPTAKEDLSAEKANLDATFGSDEESLVGGATSPVSAASSSHTPAHPPTGLEGLDTEAISETDEAIHFDELSDTSFATVEEDGEIPSKRKKKKKSRKSSGEVPKSGDEHLGDSPMHEPIDYEEGEIVEAPKKDKKKDKESEKKKETEKKGTTKISDENVDITKKASKSSEEDKRKKKKKDKATEKGRGSKDRAVLGSKENKDKTSDKTNKDDPNIAWKKPSKAKERNYRDGKGKPDSNSTKNKEGSKKRASSKEKEKDKDKEKESSARKDKEKEREKDRKKKDKRQDMERYDVRKIVTDKKRSKRRDEFGRDLLRDRSYTRTRSLSFTRLRGRSRSISRTRSNRTKRTPLKTRRKTRSRSRGRSRSRSKLRNRSRPKARVRSRDRPKISRSRERLKRYSPDRSRNRKRSRTRTRTRSRNRSRMRSRTRTPLRARDRKDHRQNVQPEKLRYDRRSMSPSWTPSWSQSGSLTGSSYSRSQSASPGKHFRSYSRSYSRSWTPEQRIPAVSKKTGAISKAAKKLTVTVTNTKESQKKKEKKKKDIKRKESHPGDKKRKRKDKSPAPSKEVFTSGDNILVSVNFNKSNKGSSKDTGNIVLTKDTVKRKTTDDGNKNPTKKLRKGLGKEKPSPQGVKARLGEKKNKKNTGPRFSRIAAAAKKKPMAIIDLDQSPFREQTPSPTDLIVLSDSEDEIMDKEGGEEVGRRARENSRSPKGSSKTGTNTATNVSESQSPIMNNIGSYLVTSTGPKTPPEPQVKFSIAPKQTLRSIMNPLQEEDEDLGDDAIMDNIDRRIEEELNRNMGELLHKGPNTPPEPRGPSTPCSSPTSPDAYDPFDPTKSRSPSPVRPGVGPDRPSPTHTPTVDLTKERDSPMPSEREDPLKGQETQAKAPVDEVTEGTKSPERATVDSTTKSPAVVSESPLPSTTEPPQDSAESSEKTKQPLVVSTIADSGSKSPERNTVPVISQAPKPTPTKQFVVKPVPVSQGPAVNSTSSHATVAASPVIAALTSANIATMLRATPASALPNRNIFAQPSPMSITQLIGHHHLQHQFLGSPAVTRLPTNVDRPSLQKILPQKPIAIKPSPQKISTQKSARTLNGEQMLKAALDKSTDVVDMELESPYSPASSEANDLFEPPVDLTKSHPRSTPTKKHQAAMHKSPAKLGDKFDTIFGESPLRGKRPGGRPAPTKHVMKNNKSKGGGKFDKTGKSKKEIGIKMDEEKLQILAELPSSAVELQVKDKWLKKLNRQERVVEEVKLSLKPHYAKKHVSKEEYKDILRRSVPKICHNRSGEINPLKIASLVEAYVKRYRYNKKKGSGSAPKPKAKTSMWS